VIDMALYPKNVREKHHKLSAFREKA
jgi:hypothetical protein